MLVMEIGQLPLNRSGRLLQVIHRNASKALHWGVHTAKVKVNGQYYELFKLFFYLVCDISVPHLRNLN